MPFLPILPPKCPSANEWIKKLCYIYTMEFYAAERKKELLPFVTAWMELENIMLRGYIFLSRLSVQLPLLIMDG